GVYHWFPKMYGRYLNSTLAYIHFWVTIIGAYLIFWPMHYEGLAGMPRRYYDYSGWESFKMFGGLNEFISFIAMIVFATQLLFVFSTVVSYLLATDYRNLLDVLLLFAGGMLITGSANTINQITEKDTDALMKRTAGRPVASGRMSVKEASFFAVITGITGLLI